MAKDNLFLGMARGKVGDVVFSRLNGVQITRARNRAPKNPQSVLQLAQRVIMKTASMAYSIVQDIANHSFEGYPEGTANQSRFVKSNIAQMRAQLESYLNSGNDARILACKEINFSFAQEVFPVIRPYLLSEGTLTGLTLSMVDSGTNARLNLTGAGESITGEAGNDMTYAEVARYLGVDQGDQITICLLGFYPGVYLDSPCFSSMKVARIIMDPIDGDMTHPFLDSATLNPRNEVPESWVISALYLQDGGVPSIQITTDMPRVTDEPIEGGLCGFAAIRSKRVGDSWLRSTSLFSIPENAHFEGHEFGTAIKSFKRQESSNLYLNQSEG